MVAYTPDFKSAYNPDKIQNLQTNSVNVYFDWDDVPKKLKTFVEEGDD